MGKGDSYRPTDPAHVLRCEEVGHAMPSIKGQCTRCGAYLWGTPLTFPAIPEPSTPEDSDG